MDRATLLAEYTKARRRTAFAWGSFDCALFASDWLVALGHADPAARFRGRYDSALGAARELAAAGVDSLFDLPAGHGLAEIAPATARRGDLVAVHVGGRDALAVCVGGRAAVPGPEGLQFVPLRDWTRAWRVED